MIDEFDALLSLMELGLPSDIAQDLINEVPVAEITREIRNAYEWNIPLGRFVDNFAYRQKRIRDQWDSALVNVWRPLTSPEMLIEVGSMLESKS